MSERRYAQGGYVGGPDKPDAPTWLHPDECVIAYLDGTFVCRRPHHTHPRPTPEAT